MRKWIDLFEQYNALPDRINDFIEQHAKLNADYDPKWDAPDERFNGPDSLLLWQAGEALRTGVAFPKVHSTYTSGCYSPMMDKEAMALHDELVKAVNELATL